MLSNMMVSASVFSTPTASSMVVLTIFIKLMKMLPMKEYFIYERRAEYKITMNTD